MKVTAIGRYGKYPNKDGATCCYLIESAQTKIVLDMGSASLKNLDKVIDYKHIDAVVVSHFHGDHCADAFVFRNVAFEFIKTGVWDTKLPFFMPKEPYNEFMALKSCEGFQTIEISDGLKTAIKDIDLEFFKVNHPLPTYAVKVSSNEKSLSYTADIMDKENLDRLFLGADFAIVDACILEKNHKQGLPHISVKEIAYITKDIPKVMLAHLEYGKEEETLQEALSQNKKAFLAEELKTYHI